MSDMSTPAINVRRIGIIGVAVTIALFGVGLLWAKWMPYTDKIATLTDTHQWSGKSVFLASGQPGAAPTTHGAWAFWAAYFQSVWKAIVVAVVVAAAIEVFVPRRWLVGLFARRTAFGQGALAGLAATPSMMCTCCTAPVAIGLRRRGVPLGATVAYWLANPLLNPAVLAFIALTLPWQFVATRLVVGVLVVLGAAMLANKLMTRGQPTAFATDSDEIDTPRIGNVLGRFGLTLAKYLAILVPEYALLVLLTGWFSGWLSNFAGLDRAAGPIALLAVGAVGAALVIPTGGEIPVIIGLLAAGASLGVVGTLLITLPALSLPSMVMVARTMTWQVIAAIATLVIAGGLLAVGVLTAIA